MKSFYLLLALIFTFTGAFAQIAADIITPVHAVKHETVNEIMERAKHSPAPKVFLRPEKEYPDRSLLPQNSSSAYKASYPDNNQFTGGNNGPTSLLGAQTPALSFNGVTGPTETSSFPPDDMGSIGPSQYIVAVNGRIRSFNKTTGVADGVLNANPDVFFASVMTPVPAGGVNFTSDPRIRYDRLSGKWIIIIIDVPSTSSSSIGDIANHCLIAVSNTSTITAATVWTFTQFLGQTNVFFDYPTLGVDINAIYIGGNMFGLTSPFAFLGTNGYVINRTALLSGSYTVYSFFNIATASVGPYTPQGVDNFDLAAAEGYFIGSDVGTLGRLVMRRILTPAAVPTISANINITVNATAQPQTVPHLGNAASPTANGELDALDDRLYGAMARNGHLWTAHNISVNTTGAAQTTGNTRRNGCRWYDLTNLTTTPTVNQSGTIFDPAATTANPRWYSIPTVMLSGQGHAAFSITTGGNNDRANAATTGRLSGDALGTTQAAALTTGSATAYNPPGDPGGSFGRRWGDYSYVSLDPLDDMTMWMIHQYCVGTNLYGCNVTKLLAPPPATPAVSNPPATVAGQASVNIIITGTAISGSGFYDPGANLTAPALPFNHITASVTGGVIVNSVTYTSPTSVTLNISTVGASTGLQSITVTNPDGQSISSVGGILTINAVVPVNILSFTAKKSNKAALLNWSTAQEQNNKGFEVQRSADGNFNINNYTVLGFVAGAGNSTQVRNYQLTDNGPLKGKNFYRLKQVDLDNTARMSESRRIDFVTDNKPVLYPNPFSDAIQVFNVTDRSDYRILDAKGQVVLQGKLNNNEIKTSRLPGGIYTIQITDAGNKTQMQLIKK